MTTWFLSIDEGYRAIFFEWVSYLRDEKLFGNEDALFPKPEMGIGVTGGFEVIGLSRETYQTSTALRDTIKQAFLSAGLPSFAPHSFRKTVVKWGDKAYPDRESFKAFSLNIGHSETATTMNAYYPISTERQAELIRSGGL